MPQQLMQWRTKPNHNRNKEKSFKKQYFFSPLLPTDGHIDILIASFIHRSTGDDVLGVQNALAL